MKNTGNLPSENAGAPPDEAEQTAAVPDRAGATELPPRSIAALLQAQVAECVDVVRDMAEYAKDPRLISHERIHVIGAIGELIQQCSNVGLVIARLNGGSEGTRHTVVVEDKRGKRRGEGVKNRENNGRGKPGQMA